ncbi:hypothetical protein VTH06DRAFT_6966 [Thermothelomyces fergusii]
MAAQGLEDVYASLLLTDTYLPGALVLAHSLRDAGTTKKLAILVTLDTVSVEVVKQLETVYDYVIPVDRIRNEHPANLDLMNRRDLHSAFTKINLWKQTQFRKIVYADADIVASRAPDELFDLPHNFSAAPDIGWPDLFNTGLMVLTPNLGDYNALLAMAQKGVSFDGADQGLLNMYFKNDYNRLSFSYNVTPSAHYQYLPAYKHFRSTISMVHFIGTDKPWLQGRDKAAGNSPFDQMLGIWWAVYDRHYRSSAEKQVPEIVQYFVKGEFQPTIRYVVPVGEPQPPAESEPSWDAQKQPPPLNSKPEAIDLPQAHYAMSSDTAPFVPPERYPSPPKNMWYEVPKTPPAKPEEKPKPIFPWETHQPKPARVFGPATKSGAQAAKSNGEASEPSQAQPVPRTPPPPSPSQPPLSRPTPPKPTDPWSSFPRSNAWDDVPEINRYVDRELLKHRRSRSRNLDLEGLTGDGKEAAASATDEFGQVFFPARKGAKVTDFPSEDDRPSLPVTPAPIRRPRRWGSGAGSGDDMGEGGEQADWDPAAQLQKLAKEQSEMLLRRLGGGGGGDSEGQEVGSGKGTQEETAPPAVVSPKPINPRTGTSPVDRILAAAPDIARSQDYRGPGAAFKKSENVPAFETPTLPTEEERDILDT